MMTHGEHETVKRARKLLVRLSARVQISGDLHEEIDAVEEELWNLLYPGRADFRPKIGETEFRGAVSTDDDR